MSRASLGLELQRKQYTQAVVLRTVRNLDSSKLQQWLKRGHLTVSGDPRGTGHRRLWSALDVIQLAAIMELTKMGLPVGLAAYISKMVWEWANRGLLDPFRTDGPDPVWYVMRSANDVTFSVGPSSQNLSLEERDRVYGPRFATLEIRPALISREVYEKLKEFQTSQQSND